MKKYFKPEITTIYLSLENVLYASVGAGDSNVGGDNIGSNNDFV